MSRGKTDRAADERLLTLTLIRMRCGGLTLRQIGTRFGMSFANIDKLTRQVREADLRESGEPPQMVDRAYWKVGRW